MNIKAISKCLFTTNLLVLAFALTAHATHVPPSLKGAKGDSGAPGQNGKDAGNNALAIPFGIGVQVHDSKNWNVPVYYQHDVLNNGNTLGALAIYKFGKDHNDTEIDTLKRKLEALEAKLVAEQSSKPHTPPEKTIKATIKGSK